MLELVKHFGESTAYSAKGHFKSADFRRILIYFFVSINIIFSVLSMLDIFCEIAIKIMSVVSLLASIFILVYQTKDEADFITNSMRAGEEYLKLHNEIYLSFISGNLSQEDVERITEKVNTINSKAKPHISIIGKFWAKYSIEKMGEMRIWWK